MDPEIHIKTAQIYEKLGREEEAMNEYKIASKVLDMKED
jgi:Tfp pilus assembly protein PilF